MKPDWLLIMAEQDVLKLAVYPDELYERSEPVCRALAAARDAMQSIMTEADIEALRRRVLADVSSLVDDFLKTKR